MAKRIDLFDVEALEKSVNDSAVRVSTIWVTFLLFGLYLAVAAFSATHRQLFLEEPIKLPALNIDLPLVLFFFLAPILFFVFHVYLLMQILLLASTAAEYNEALARKVPERKKQTRLRHRLANTLFAQLFAGTQQKGDELLKILLLGMAWFTLAIGPALVLLLFEFRFLPYQSSVVTSSHRATIAFDLVAVIRLWPGILDAKRGIAWGGSKQFLVSIAAAISFIAIPVLLLSFPGESHSRLTRYATSKSDFNKSLLPECSDKSILAFDFFLNFARLSLGYEDFVDDDKLAKIENVTISKGQHPSASERIRKFDNRNLSCGDFRSADLRRTSFENSNLSGALLYDVELQGGLLVQTNLRSARLDRAKLQGADLGFAQMQGADLGAAELQGSFLNGAQLQGADLRAALLLGAYLTGSQMQGTSLDRAQLQGADLSGVELQDASLDGARLQGASFNQAKLQGASFVESQLQGANFEESILNLTDISNAYVWRATSGNCGTASVAKPNLEAIIDIENNENNSTREIRATPETTEKFIEDSVRRVPESEKEELRKRLRTRLVAELKADEVRKIEKTWQDCAAKTLSSEDDGALVAYLNELVCKTTNYQREIAMGVKRNWIGNLDSLTNVSHPLARRYLALDGGPCVGTESLDEQTKNELREIITKKEKEIEQTP